MRRLGPGINWRLVVPMVSGALGAVGLAMAACFAFAVAGGDGAALALGLPAAVSLPVAAAGLRGARLLRRVPLRARDGFLAVALAWLVAAVAGAAPFLIEGTFERPVHALFESMSGITTTGATLLGDIESVPDGLLLWRSLSQWLGGAGIVVLVVAIAPAAGLASQRVFYAETSGVVPDRLTPRIAETAKIVWALFLAFTALAALAYLAAGMAPFDALNHSLTTVATGGFSTRTASLAAFDSMAVELVAIVFMAVGGVNFAFYYRAMRGMPVRPQSDEVRVYLLLLAGSVAVVTLSLALSDRGADTWQHLREAAFSVTTLMTGTGYTTADYDTFNDFARGYLVLLMFVGGCAGSTAGGTKVIRVMLLARTAGQEVQRQLQPKAVQVLRTRSRIFGEDVRRGVLGFFYIYVTVAIAGTLAMLASGAELVTAFGSVAATINVVGPGIGDVGGAENYESISEGGLVVLSLLMLAGRLEIFTLLVLLTPAFWRRNIA